MPAVVLAVNKCENVGKADLMAAEFWGTGLEPIPVSAISGSGGPGTHLTAGWPSTAVHLVDSVQSLVLRCYLPSAILEHCQVATPGAVESAHVSAVTLAPSSRLIDASLQAPGTYWSVWLHACLSRRPWPMRQTS